MTHALIWPMMAQAFLTYAIYVVLYRRRVQSVRSGQAKVSDFKVPMGDPPASAAAARCLANQFELPVLFFAACVATHASGAASLLTVALAWIFVLSRIAHAAIYLTSNRVRFRQRFFSIGLLANAGQWLSLAWYLVVNG